MLFRSIEFQKYLEIKKQEFGDEKEAAEWAYKKWLKEKQREFEREESRNRLKNDYDRSELNLFFKDWPLHAEINTILGLYQDKNTTGNQAPLNIILGKHNIGRSVDILSENYDRICDKTTTKLYEIGFSGETFFKFRHENKTISGAALANVYALMNKFPTLMIMPNLLDDRLYFNVGVWGQGSVLPMQKSMFSIECDLLMMQNNANYLEEKKKEIALSQITLSGVINDTYRITEYNAPPLFPQFMEKYEIIKYPHLKEFAKREYKSLQEPVSIEFEGNLFLSSELYSIKERDEIIAQTTHALKLLK